MAFLYLEAIRQSGGCQILSSKKFCQGATKTHHDILGQKFSFILLRNFKHNNSRLSFIISLCTVDHERYRAAEDFRVKISLSQLINMRIIAADNHSQSILHYLTHKRNHYKNFQLGYITLDADAPIRT